MIALGVVASYETYMASLMESVVLLHLVMGAIVAEVWGWRN